MTPSPSPKSAARVAGSLFWLSLKVLIVIYLMKGGIQPFLYQNF